MRPHPALSGTVPKQSWLPIGLGSQLRFVVKIWMQGLGVLSVFTAENRPIPHQ
jgi:hypothetical protein